MIKLYNTLTRKKENFKPIVKGRVGIYSCGPTVYWYQHIGNLRTAILADFLKRVFIYNNYKVIHVMNFTDVDDKTIKSSKKENLALKELTRKYERVYLEDIESANIIKPSKFLRATENIKEMVEIVNILLKNGLAYTAKEGIYFSINKLKNYGKLARLDKITKTKERIISDEYDKTNARDFALWKFYTAEDGDVFWKTKIGKGRPGWHIECSAMSMKVLGENFDIHTGGMDLIFPHHTNEIAQSEGATGKKFVNYWVHGGMLNLKEGKMSKSLGNIYTFNDLRKQGYEPIHFRYLTLQTHYKKPLEFSFEALDAAKNAYEKIKRKIIELRGEKHKGNDSTKEYSAKFLEAVNDDLNMPRALEVFWGVLEDKDFEVKKKLKLLEKFDEVLGLGIKNMKGEKIDVPKDVMDLVREREKLRAAKMWVEADIFRERIRGRGFLVEDGDGESVVREV